MDIKNLFVDVDIHPLNHYIDSTLGKDVAKSEDGYISVQTYSSGDLATSDAPVR